MSNYYLILGLPCGATENLIKIAFRRLAKQYHPDCNPGNPQAEVRFKQVGEAYAILSDPAKRKMYDEQLLASQRLATAIAAYPLAANNQQNKLQQDDLPTLGIRLLALYLLFKAFSR